jgi:hypothetical protein
MLTKILKTIIAYVGTAWATRLIKISLPPIHRSFSIQPLMHIVILSIRCLKQSLLSAPTKASKPRYLSLRDPLIISKDSHTSNFTSVSILPKKNILYLAAFKICPKLWQYIPRISLRKSTLDLSACIRINESSANRR